MQAATLTFIHIYLQANWAMGYNVTNLNFWECYDTFGHSRVQTITFAYQRKLCQIG